MQHTITNPLEEIKQEIEQLLKKHNLKWSKLNIYETSDGYLALIRTSQIKDHLKAIELSLKLEEELKDPEVSISIVPISS